MKIFQNTVCMLQKKKKFVSLNVTGEVVPSWFLGFLLFTEHVFSSKCL